MSLNGAAATIFLLLAPTAQQPAGDPAPAARRVAATVNLAAQEYRVGVSGGRVVARPEVDEAKLFLAEARRSAALLPLHASRTTTSQLDSLDALVSRTASPDAIDAHARTLSAELQHQLGISLDEIPSAAPSFARGAAVYQANCTACHGAVGRADGPAAAGLDPKPANLADAETLRHRSPLDFYRRVSIGVVGTSMPAFESRLSPEDRWAVALYASTLRLPTPSGTVPPALRGFATSASLSDSALAEAMGMSPGDAHATARVAAVRTYGTESTAAASGPVFAAVRARLDTVFTLAGLGRGQDASSKAFDAYMTFEQVERSVRAKNPGLAGRLEASFASLRTRTAGGATRDELSAIRGDLAAQLENAERTVVDKLSPVNLFTQSFVLLVREGLEAILIVGALMAFLAKTGAAHRKRDIHIGVGAAVAASLLTAAALETIFHLTPGRREALEGTTVLIAAAVLFYVSYWLLSKMEVARWNHFVKSKVQEALGNGSALALASVAFLAVYREGFETVLFYKALLLSGGTSGSVMPVAAGIALGSVVLVGVYVAINRFGMRLPLKPFFAFTGSFLYYMAFVFAGKGVAELQEGGLIPTTVLPWAEAIRMPSLGIYATLESLALQAALLTLFIGAMLWTFLVTPRRLKVTSVMVPDPIRPAPVPPAASPPSPMPTVELLRSLDRMEADLAALRAEVDRMRDNVTQPKPESSRRAR